MLSMLIRYPIWVIKNLFRRPRRPPDYITFTLSGEYSEYQTPPGNLIVRRIRPKKESLQELGEQFRAIAADSRVKGVVLHVRPLAMPPAALESLRELVIELRVAGKHVVAWATFYTSSSYLVACAADEMLLQPAGHVEMLGMSRTFPYLAKALKKVGMQGDFIPITPYKSGGDMFWRKDMSKEVREMSNWLIDSIYTERLRIIADSRGMEVEKAQELVDETPFQDDRALELGAVDGLLSEEDLPDHLGSGGKPARLATWEKAQSSLLLERPVRAGRYVALVPIEGTIVDGPSVRPPITPPFEIPILGGPRAGDLTVVQAARKAVRDKRAAAVVVYVDSPGGSATSSEAMRAALEKIGAKKPLVVSMGPVAGSGGYWVSTPGRYIFAQASTLTGSIGVYLGKIVTHDLLDRLGITLEKIQRGKQSDIYGIESKFTKQQRKMLWEQIMRIYELFLDHVTESRDMSREAVDAVGGGRVWTGRQAIDNGLVDEIGGLQKAIAKARELAGLNPRAPVRLVTAGKTPIVPLDATAAMVEYVVDGARLFQGARPLLLSMFSFDWR